MAVWLTGPKGERHAGGNAGALRVEGAGSELNQAGGEPADSEAQWAGAFGDFRVGTQQECERPETSLIALVHLFLKARSLQSVGMLRHPENAVLKIYVTLGDVWSNNAPGFGST